MSPSLDLKGVASMNGAVAVIYVLLVVAFTIGTGMLGRKKGYPVLGWILGFFLGIIGLIIVACIPAKKPAASPQPGSAV